MAKVTKVKRRIPKKPEENKSQKNPAKAASITPSGRTGFSNNIQRKRSPRDMYKRMWNNPK